MDVISILGYVTLSFSLYHITCFTWKIFRGYILTKLGMAKNLLDYGKWAAVSGATDGIGKEYARQLAKQGMNIILMSRTLSKLETVANEIRNEFSVEVKVIQFDFSKLADYSMIEEELSLLDIGILVNNVGMALGSLKPLYENNMERVCGMITCNIFPDVKLTSIVLKGMVQRKRGMVIHISSGSILFNAPYLSMYPGTKCFIEKFATSMQYETYGIVEHQLVTPMYVASNMSKMKPMFTIPTPHEYVVQALRTVGILDCTCGYWSHEFLYGLIYLIPGFITRSVLKRIRESALKKHQ